MKNLTEKFGRLLITSMVIATIGLVVIKITGTIGLESPGVMGVLLIVYAGILLRAIQVIPANPPHVAQTTFLGKRIPVIKKEGWRIYLLRPWLYNYILIPITKVNQDLDEVEALTPDRGRVKIPVALTWTPDTDPTPVSGVVPLVNFINAGGISGVSDIIQDIAIERIREWASSSDEGPQTWDDALRSRESATAILLKAIAGGSLGEISSKVPTTILIKYFAKSGKKPLASEAKEWGKNWEGVKDAITKESQDPARQAEASAAGKSYEDLLRGQIEERWRDIEKARAGNGGYRIPQLGIVLNRLNVGQILPTGRVALVADRQAEEVQEREAETVELEHVRNRIIEYVGMGFTLEAAREIVMVERGKATLTVSENKWVISKETRDMIERIAPDLIAKLLGVVFQKGGQGVPNPTTTS